MRQPVPRDIIWLAALALVLVAGGAGWLLLSRPRAIPPARPMPTLPTDVQVRLGKVQLQGISGGSIVWEVEAEQFDWGKRRSTLTVGGLKQAALVNNGKRELTLTARTLEQNTASGRITVSGDVTVQGPALKITAPTATWDPFRESLLFVRPLTMRFGDFSLTCLGSTLLDVKTGIFTAQGGIELVTQDNTLRAQTVTVNINDHTFDLGGPVVASLAVADVTSWAEGRQLPSIPEIPESIKKLYRERVKKEAPAARPGARPRLRGVRP